MTMHVGRYLLSLAAFEVAGKMQGVRVARAHGVGLDHRGRGGKRARACGQFACERTPKRIRLGRGG